MDDVTVSPRSLGVQLTEDVRASLRLCVAEFNQLLEEAYGPRALDRPVGFQPSIVCDGAANPNKHPLDLPPVATGEDANTYVLTRLIPHFEDVLIPRLRQRIAEHSAAAQKKRTLTEALERIAGELLQAESRSRDQHQTTDRWNGSRHLLQ